MKVLSTSRVSFVTQILLSTLVTGLMIVQPCASFATAPEREFTGPALTADQKIGQALTRLSFGVRPGDFDAVKKIGVAKYIEQQLDPDSIDDLALDKRLAKLPTLTLSNPTMAEQYNPPKPTPTPTPSPTPAVAAAAVEAPKMDAATPMTDATMMTSTVAAAAAATSPSPTPAAKPSPTPIPKTPGMVVTELQRAKLLRAVYSERQLSEVVVDFWENHFSIYANKDADRWLLTGFDRDAIRPFAMGRFRDLLGATAHSPAMLFYLDNWQSTVLHEYPATKDKPARKTGGINENYARELMELHTLGVDGGYTQKDVQEVARCFTGWSIRNPNQEGLFVYNPGQHDNGEKTVLGTRIAAGGGIGDAEKVLDILAKHPSTARFIATKLARRFIGDNPPKTVVDRAASVFLKTDGSIRETLKSIIDSPEFSSPAAFGAKVRTPFEYVAASLRATAAETDANRPILDWVSKMGQPIFGRVTPDGYPDMSSEWLSNNDLLARFNFSVALSANKITGTKIDAKKLLDNTQPPNPGSVVAALTKLILMDQVSKHTKDALDKAASEAAKLASMPSSATLMSNTGVVKPSAFAVDPKISADNYVSQLLALTLGAPEFQRK